MSARHRQRMFGMARETGELSNARRSARSTTTPAWRNAGRMLLKKNKPDQRARRTTISVCWRTGEARCSGYIHVAIGSDIPHRSLRWTVAATARHVRRLSKSSRSDHKLEGGVLINIGSSVLLPTIIESRWPCGRNLGPRRARLHRRQFRFYPTLSSTWNPRARANELSDGMARHLYHGHHELTLPLLFAAVNQRLDEQKWRRTSGGGAIASHTASDGA
jgi:hypothetical protein